MPQFAPRLLPRQAKDLEDAFRDILTGSPPADVNSVRATLLKYIIPTVRWHISGSLYNFDDVVRFTLDSRVKQEILHVRVLEYMRTGNVMANKHVVDGRLRENGAFVSTECMQFVTVDEDGMITEVMEMSKELIPVGVFPSRFGAVGTLTWSAWGKLRWNDKDGWVYE